MSHNNNNNNEDNTAATATKRTDDGPEDSTPVLKPLFEALKENDDAVLSFADGFRDKVRALFEHFDHDHDGRLRFQELSALQSATTNNTDGDGSPPPLSEEMYVMACQSLNCHPDEGLRLEALKFTYAADGNSSIDEDYARVFDAETGKPRKVVVRVDVDADNDNGDRVYEIGSNGVVDISS